MAARRAEIEGRRLSSAGRGLIVILLGIFFGLLLDARGLHKSAFNQPAGPERTVALALTGAIAGISDALKLDQPRAWLKDAIGRSGDDSIDTRVVVPAPVAPLQGPRPVLSTHASVPGDLSVVRRAFTPTDPLRLWVAGDSLIIDTGYALQRAALATPVIKSVGGVDGRIGTGLERPDVFNWFLEIRSQLKALHPNAVVLGFGGNDDKGYMTGLPPDVSITAFDDPAWRREYARRVGGIIDLINRTGAYVVWVGMPITRDPAQTARFDAINGVVAQQVDKRPGGAAYLDTYSLLAGPNGGYAQYLTTLSGDVQDVRAPDGVHFTPAGAAIVAREVLKDLNTAYDLTSWRRREASTK
jgi:lysophospholipase L1-like esterase